MATEPLYLRQDVIVEPLIDRWLAWSHMLSPATFALNIVNRYVKIMESYVAAPQLHAKAMLDPNMRGGPFIDLGGQHADEIAALLRDMRTNRAALIDLAKAIRDTYALLKQHGDGHSLEGLYPKLPDALRGYAELVYSISGAPELRLLEPLLYRSRYYQPSAQSARVSVLAGDRRPFGMSTPRLSEPGTFDFARAFADQGYDALARLRWQAQSLEAIADSLALDGDQVDRFHAFLTPQPPRRQPAAPLSAARWRYFGHACVAIETPGGRCALTDPFIGYPQAGGRPRYTLADLPERIDFVTITHNHLDHVQLETLLALRQRIGTIVLPMGSGALEDPSLRLALQAAGFARIVELDALDHVSAGDLTITALPFLGEHADLAIRTKAAFHVDAAGLTMLFAADSNNLEPRLYDYLREAVGPVDTLFLGMECEGAPLSWVYGALLPKPLERSKDQSRRLNGSDYPDALKVVESLGCREVNVYAMGLEPWTTFISGIEFNENLPQIRASNALLAACEDRGIPAIRLYGQADGVAPAA
jgi:L-ascorbate metabolism protein UlaG (beta-lactamase superfamily)